MKIAYIFDLIYPYSKGGVERRTWELAKWHVQRGHKVTIFGMKQWEGEDIIYKEGVRLWGVFPPRQLYVNNRRSIKAAIYFAWKLLPPLLKERFDIINTSNSPYFPCFSAKISSIFKRTPLVISWWEIWGDYWYEYLGKKGILGKIIERMTAKLPHRMIVETEKTKEVLISWGYNPDKIAIIPSGTPFKKIQEIPCTTRENEKTDVIFVGRLVKYKGAHTLVESIAYLKKNGKEVTASIIGDGSERESLKVLAKELNVEDRIKFYGRIEEDDRVISLMKGAKVFVYAPAPLGGWALTPIEANACGLPVISTKSGVLGSNDRNEVVVNGYNGFLVDEQLPELIAEKIALILENHQLRGELQRNALNFARSLDWENQTEAIEKVYQELLKNHR